MCFASPSNEALQVTRYEPRSRWTELAPFNGDLTMTAALPAIDTDAKSEAFYLMSDVTKLRFQSQYSGTFVSFVSANSPMTLMTNNGINFQRYPVYAEWTATFGHDRFVRGLCSFQPLCHFCNVLVWNVCNPVYADSYFDRSIPHSLSSAHP